MYPWTAVLLILSLLPTHYLHDRLFRYLLLVSYKLRWGLGDLLLIFLLKVYECLTKLELDAVIVQRPFQ